MFQSFLIPSSHYNYPEDSESSSSSSSRSSSSTTSAQKPKKAKQNTNNNLTDNNNENVNGNNNNNGVCKKPQVKNASAPRWSESDDLRLAELVASQGPKWTLLQEQFFTATSIHSLRHRWERIQAAFHALNNATGNKSTIKDTIRHMHRNVNIGGGLVGVANNNQNQKKKRYSKEGK